MTVIFNRRTLRHSDLQIRLPWLRPVWAAAQKLLASIMGCFISEWRCLGRVISNRDCCADGVSVEVTADNQEGTHRAEWSEHGATSNNTSKENLFLSLIQHLQAKETNFQLSRVMLSLLSASLYFEGRQIDFFFFFKYQQAAQSHHCTSRHPSLK